MRRGDDLCLVTFGAMLPPCLEAAECLSSEDGVETTVIDLLSLSPLDHAKAAEAARRTGRVVVVHEAPRSFGPAGEIATRIMEESFLYLEAPVRRVTGYDVHVPFFAREQLYLPNTERIVDACRETLEF